MQLLLAENTARVVDQADFELREPPVSDPENGDWKGVYHFAEQIEF